MLLNIDMSIQQVSLDSGALNASFITEQKAKELSLNVENCNNTILIAYDKSTSKPLGRTQPILISTGTRLALTSFVVVPELVLGPIVIGLPDMTKLQLVTINLPDPLKHRLVLEREICDENGEPYPAGNNISNLIEEEIEPHRDDMLTAIHPKDVHKVEAFMISPVFKQLLDENAAISGFIKAPPVALDLLHRNPVFHQQRLVPEAERAVVGAQIAKWKAQGKIKKTHSPWNLSLVTAPKKDEFGNISGTRVCVDPRPVNKILINDGFPIPNLGEIFQSFKGMKYFSEIDLTDAFLQLELAERDQKVMSFTWEGIQYSFVGCPFGLKLMSNLFQRTIQGIFADMPFVKVYIDNISVSSTSWVEHKTFLEAVLHRLNKYNFKIAPHKLKVGRRAIRLLGHEISREGVRPDPRKVAEVRAWPFPADVKALQSFLGVVNYVRGHIKHMPTVSKALDRARHSQAAYDREVISNRDDMEKSFELLKEAISHAPLLRFPDFSRPFYMAPDASWLGIGAVLYQPTPNQEEAGDTSLTSENIVAITSRALHTYELNYVVYKLEALAIINALKHFHQFLYGRHFTLHTDHRALTYVLDGKENRTLGGWLNTMLEYNFDIVHVPGNQNVLPDHLSRLYSKSDAWGVPNVLASQAKREKLLKKLQQGTHTAETVPKGSINSGQSLNGEQVVIAPVMVSQSSNLETDLTDLPPNSDIRRVKEREELMLLLGRTIPPENMRAKLIAQAHAAGHYSDRIITEHLYNTLRVWWPTMGQEVRTHIQACDTCLRYNVSRKGFHPLRSPRVDMPGDWWQVDLIDMSVNGKASKNGYSYVLCVIDLFTSYAITRPLKTKGMEEVAHNLYQIMCDWGPPIILQSDEGKEFINQVLERVCDMLKVKQKPATPHTHRAMGSVERLNRTVEESLRKLLGGALALWDEVLPLATFYYNTTVRSLSKTSPYALMFTRAWNSWGEDGRQSVAIENFDEDDLSQRLGQFDASDWVDIHQKRVLEHVYPAITDSIKEKRRKTAEAFAKHHKISPEPLKVGDKVYVLDEHKSNKHAENWLGPYKVQEVSDNWTYWVQDSLGSRLRRSRPQLKPAPADTAGEGEEFEVEHIVSHRAVHGNESPEKAEYLIKWAGYSHSHNTWEPYGNIMDKQLITTYWSKAAQPRQTKKSKAAPKAAKPQQKQKSKAKASKTKQSKRKR